jgi:hypothetical protein
MKFPRAADIHLDSALHGLQRYEGAPATVDPLAGGSPIRLVAVSDSAR